MSTTAPDTPAGVPVVTPQLLAAFERLALVIRSADAELALAAMDADLLLRASLPGGAVEASAPTDGAGPLPTDPVDLTVEAVEMLDRHANVSKSATVALANIEATERLTRVLQNRSVAREWVEGRIAQEQA